MTALIVSCMADLQKSIHGLDFDVQKISLVNAVGHHHITEIGRMHVRLPWSITFNQHVHVTSCLVLSDSLGYVQFMQGIRIVFSIVHSAFENVSLFVDTPVQAKILMSHESLGKVFVSLTSSSISNLLVVADSTFNDRDTEQVHDKQSLSSCRRWLYIRMFMSKKVLMYLWFYLGDNLHQMSVVIYLADT